MDRPEARGQGVTGYHVILYLVTVSTREGPCKILSRAITALRLTSDVDSSATLLALLYNLPMLVCISLATSPI